MLTTPAVAFRPLAHSDAAFAADAQVAVDPGHPVTPAEIVARWTSTERTSRVARNLVEVGGRPAGWISVVRANEDTVGSASGNLLVPGAEEPVLAQALARLEVLAAEIGVRDLSLGVVETFEAAVSACHGAGWELKRRDRYWRLDLPAHAERILEQRSASRERMATTGVAINTAADLGGEDIFPAIHQLGALTGPDVPSSQPYEVESYEDFLEWFSPPRILPERVFVAVVGGRPVGFSTLEFYPSLVATYFTGVLRGHRGKGIARALKLETLGQAVELGVTAVETDNDSENAPILHLNAELGYEELPSRLQFHRAIRLKPPPV